MRDTVNAVVITLYTTLAMVASLFLVVVFTAMAAVLGLITIVMSGLPSKRPVRTVQWKRHEEPRPQSRGPSTASRQGEIIEGSVVSRT
jgi:hypothetical protein